MPAATIPTTRARLADRFGHRRQHLDDGRGRELGKPRHLRIARKRGLAAAAQRSRQRLAAPRGSPLADALYRLRIAKYGRDLSEIHRRLYARGLAAARPAVPAAAARASDDLTKRSSASGR